MQDLSGHRNRVKLRYLNEGLDNFDELYVLELLLFYCVPRKDTKQIARNLLNRFGSLVQVFEASREELMEVEGVSDGIATFLELRRDVERFYQLKRAAQKEVQLTDSNSYGAYMRNLFYGKRNEMVYVLCLDAKSKVIACKLADEGSVNSANVSVRRIVEIALNTNATMIVLAHNHPSGLAFPSNDDIKTTHLVAQGLATVDVVLADHLIFTADDFISLYQSNYYRPTDRNSWI